MKSMSQLILLHTGLKRRLFFFAVLATLIGSAVFLLAHSSSPQPFRLRIVRRATDQGKPVVYFRVEGGGHLRIQITNVERIVRENVEGRYLEFDPPKGSATVRPDFWAPSQGSPTGDPIHGRNEFGVVVPTNAPVWKLRVMILFETSSLDRIKSMPSLWRSLRSSGSSFVQSTHATWTAFYDGGQQTLESEPITNTVAAR